MRKQILLAVILGLLAIPGGSLWAGQARGPVLFQDIMLCGLAGTTVGFSAGMIEYGDSGNTQPRLILRDSIYGFLGGAVVGTGIGVYEITSDTSGVGTTVGNYVAIGTLMGAFVGLIYSFVPYAMDDSDSNNFAVGSIGLGVGGLIGGSVGLGVAILDLSLRAPGGKEDDLLLSGTLGLQPETQWLSVTGDPQPTFCYRVLELHYR
jgi:hypothetical protein